MRLERIALAGLCCLFAAGGCAPRSAVNAPSQDAPPAASAPSAASAPRAEEALRFAWPAGATAEVTERILKKGRRSTTHYRIVTERDGDEWLIFYRDFEFREVEGVDLQDPRVVAAFEKLATRAVGGLPPYRVSSDGRWLGIDMDAFVALMKDVFPEEKAAAFQKVVAVPGMEAMLDEKIGEVWRAWVELWIGVQLEPGESLDAVPEVSVLGRPVSFPVTVEHLGAVDGRVHLRATSALEGPEAAAAVGAMLSQFAESVDGDAPFSASDLNTYVEKMQVRRIWTAEVVTDPITLLPTEAMLELRASVVIDGEERERVEAHEWTFEWSDGRGAAK